MKRILMIALLFFISQQTNAQISFLSEQNGTITVRTEGANKKVDNAISDAEKYVFYIIFYQGIPGSSLKNGLIDIPEAEAEQKYKEYFDLFYKERYSRFITIATQDGSIVKEKHRKKNVAIDLTININALKKDLEDNQVIRKFGF